MNNIIGPYRVPIYQKLAQVFETYILTGKQANRPYWQNVEAQLEAATVKQSWGFTFRIPKSHSDQLFDYKFLHLNPGFLWDLLRIRPDAVITNEMGLRTLIALLYGYLFNKPVWIWWGGTLHTEQHISQLKRRLRHLIAKWSKRWISYGQSSTEYLLSLGIARDQVLQIQNCVDEKVFCQSTPPKFNLQPKPVFLYIGQLLRRKGVDRMLTAAGVLQQQGHQFSLVLVGDGPERQNLQQYAESLRLQHLTFYPAQLPYEIPHFYRSADYFVFPTLEDNWGLVVNEALWSDVPVLASCYAGCAEELLPTNNLFDPLDLDDTVSILLKALNSEIAPADPSPLLACDKVAQMIIDDLQAALEKKIARSCDG